MVYFISHHDENPRLRCFCAEFFDYWKSLSIYNEKIILDSWERPKEEVERNFVSSKCSLLKFKSELYY